MARLSSSDTGGLIGAAVGYLTLLMFILGLSARLEVTLLHFAIFAGGNVVFIRRMFASPDLSLPGKLLPIAIAYLAHALVIALDRRLMYLDGRIYLDMALLPPIVAYAVVSLFGVVFVPIYGRRAADRALREKGLDARAVVLEASDTGARFTEGVHRQYRMDLVLQIEGITGSPYTVRDTFMVSEFYLHLLSGKAPIPVRVDPRNRMRVALALEEMEPETA